MKRLWGFLIFLCLLLCISCSKEDFSITAVRAQVYVRQHSSMGLSLYFIPGHAYDGDFQMAVTAPSGTLTWNFHASKADFDGVSYYGSSDIVMPDSAPIPRGTWSLDVINSDGRTLHEFFEVSYGDVAKALEKYDSSDSKGAFFDSAENITVIPCVSN